MNIPLSPEKFTTKPLTLAAYASDASFYHLTPKVVCFPENEEDIISIFKYARESNTPLAFRAGGTSLSGQAITDGILVDIRKHWRNARVEKQGDVVFFQPGVIGIALNIMLNSHKAKIGPDPASIGSAMMGGILANNSSGMCCGVKHNAYHTLESLSFILPDGQQFDTNKEEDYENFNKNCSLLANDLLSIKAEVTDNPTLLATIRRKYKTKNTVGYALNAFLDYTHPLDIFAHLLVGSEGTLAFIANARLKTLPSLPYRATGMLYFADIFNACKSIDDLKNIGAEALELMDRAALKAVAHLPGAPEAIQTLPLNAAALLCEFQAATKDALEQKMQHALPILQSLKLLFAPALTQLPAEQALLWKLRKGMFPAVGAVRAQGTTVILEDIAFPLQNLGKGILALHQLFSKYHYDNAIIFGHAKDGNIHFVITQAFDSPELINRYDHFLREMVDIVLSLEGSLKAEHGTGRNMAPFVAAEWGGAAFDIMKRLKARVDPQHILNPGVIINHNDAAHIQHLKQLPIVDNTVDKCIECGFCEPLCPSKDFTTTPRQRIVLERAMANLRLRNDRSGLKAIEKDMKFDVEDSCATDGMCAEACPVQINTGDLVKKLRANRHSPLSKSIAVSIARNFNMATALVSASLRLANMIGDNVMIKLSTRLHTLNTAIPQWMPGIRKSKVVTQDASRDGDIVYFQTCISRTMGAYKGVTLDVGEAVTILCQRAALKLVIPDDIEGLCCSQPFSSKGYNTAHEYMVEKSINALYKASNSGALPIFVDMSTCSYAFGQMKDFSGCESVVDKYNKLQFIDILDLLNEHILPHIAITSKQASIILHPTCSMIKAGKMIQMNTVAHHFADKVIIPEGFGCCGMAGDRGMLVPGLTSTATKTEALSVINSDANGFYSTATTCELAMQKATNKPYQSLLLLAELCTR